MKNVTSYRPGHRPTGGRAAGAISKKYEKARDLIERLNEELGKNVDPLEGLLRLSADTALPVEFRADCMKATISFIYPKLQAQNQEISVASEVHCELDVAALLASPELSHKAMELSMAIQCAKQQAQIAPADNILDLQRDSLGNYRS